MPADEVVIAEQPGDLQGGSMEERRINYDEEVMGLQRL